jgi:hypothetical protein
MRLEPGNPAGDGFYRSGNAAVSRSWDHRRLGAVDRDQTMKRRTNPSSTPQ